MGLSGSLIDVGLELGRLKTGTPPRLLRRSIDFSRTEVQAGDQPVPYFSYWTNDLWMEHQGPSENVPRGTLHHSHASHTSHAPSQSPESAPSMFHVEHRGTYPPGSILQQVGGQLPCYITHTTERTAKIIQENLHKSPMYSGVIEGVGPRYCPSIEDKIVKFPDKERQQIFLEPEGIATDEIYVNGFSTCLPFEVQVGLVQTIVGCEQAEILRPAYAVEYDFAFPTQLHLSLETKVCRNLYLAGQINGTSGYEEAGAQGLMAGINAARRVKGLEPIVLRRDQAYIGVLIDDLVTKGTVEPYRMFTSRAEYRLLLRQDNADLRLCDLAHEIGLLPERNYQQFVSKREAISTEMQRLENTRVGTVTLADMLRRPDVTYKSLEYNNTTLEDDVINQVEIAIKYAGYISRQEADIGKLRSLEGKQIPAAFDFNTVPSLRNEARQKLNKIRPATLGQASRISGVSPADVAILMVWLKRGAG